MMTPDGQLSSSQIYHELAAKGVFDFVTGTPCGELKDFITNASQLKSSHLSTANEREAVGIATGAWLAGKKPILYMQNSGLFAASNEIGSILIASGISIPLMVAWRGCPGESATQHLPTGEATIPLLSALRIDHITDPDAQSLDEFIDRQQESLTPYCILKTRDKFNSTDSAGQTISSQSNSGIIKNEVGSIQLSRDQALNQILEQPRDDTAYFSSTGLISRSVFHQYDGPNHFYNAGGFGFTSTIGLGYSASSSHSRTMVIEGDGSVLANLGNLNLIGKIQPKNFVHVVLNNYSYGSCSFEPTLGAERIPQIAALCGYRLAHNLKTKAGLREALAESENVTDGPVLIQVDINQTGARDFKRPLAMAETARRFRSNFSGKIVQL